MTAMRVGRTTRRVPRSRPAIGALGMLAPLAALWAALLMLGLHVPTPRPDFAEVHGPLMVLGFLGTLIALERAVAIDAAVGYLAPAAAGLGLLGLYAAAARRRASVHLAVMTAGAAAWVVAVGWHFYAHVLLLHMSLLLRLLGGDLAGNRVAWQVGGVLNEVALLCFIGVTVAAVVQGRRRRRTRPPLTHARPLVAATSTRGHLQ